MRSPYGACSFAAENLALASGKVLYLVHTLGFFFDIQTESPAFHPYALRDLVYFFHNERPVYQKPAPRHPVK